MELKLFQYIPPELSRLDTLSAQLIQRAKCYISTIVRLVTYAAKVPAYNSLKACKGTVFFLPLPLKKTLENLDVVKCSRSGETTSPDPELYIIISLKPTSSKVVWHSLLNIEHIMKVVQTLKDINWLYSEVDYDSITMSL